MSRCSFVRRPLRTSAGHLSTRIKACCYHRTRTSRGADRPIAPVRTGRLVTLVRGSYFLTDRVPQSRASDVGMDVVLPHIQAGREDHLYAAAPIRRRRENVTVTLRGI